MPLKNSNRSTLFKTRMTSLRAISLWAILLLLVPISFAGSPTDSEPSTTLPTPLPLGSQLWVGKFSQCSFNAVGSVLTYYYGIDRSKADRKTFEGSVFTAPIGAVGYGAYFGWGPWTSYMVESGKMVWNEHPVTTLKAERFSLRTARIPTLQAQSFIVHYDEGEREMLRTRLLKELARGPVVLWTCYAGVQDKGIGQPWHHVSRTDDRTDAVPFGPFTHSVTLYLMPRSPNVRGLDGDVDRLLVTDCSVAQGIFITDPDTIISTASAMAAFVRLHAPGEKSMFEKGFKGIENDQYNVLFIPKTSASTAPSATQHAERSPLHEKPQYTTHEQSAPAIPLP